MVANALLCSTAHSFASSPPTSRCTHCSTVSDARNTAAGARPAASGTLTSPRGRSSLVDVVSEHAALEREPLHHPHESLRRRVAHRADEGGDTNQIPQPRGSYRVSIRVRHGQQTRRSENDDVEASPLVWRHRRVSSDPRARRGAARRRRPLRARPEPPRRFAETKKNALRRPARGAPRGVSPSNARRGGRGAVGERGVHATSRHFANSRATRFRRLICRAFHRRQRRQHRGRRPDDSAPRQDANAPRIFATIGVSVASARRFHPLAAPSLVGCLRAYMALSRRLAKRATRRRTGRAARSSVDSDPRRESRDFLE